MSTKISAPNWNPRYAKKWKSPAPTVPTVPPIQRAAQHNPKTSPPPTARQYQQTQQLPPTNPDQPTPASLLIQSRSFALLFEPTGRANRFWQPSISCSPHV